MMYLRLVKARASRIADMVASVPELTKRTLWMFGNALITNSARSASEGVEAPKLVPLQAAPTIASSTFGSACPRISGPHDPMKSMYSFSSASHTCDPLPRTINGGSPPTDLNARTGEFTPPGIRLSARCCRRRDCSVLRKVVEGINSSRHGENRCQSNWDASVYYSSGPNSSD